MKRITFLLLASFLCYLTVSAHDFEVNGIFYNIYSATEATVTYKGESSDSYSNEYRGNVTIPSTVTYNGTTYSVTRIGGYAFSMCDGLTGISIPNSISIIGVFAFYGCDGLNNVSIPNSVTRINTYAFGHCDGLISITIGNSVKTIGANAFIGCSSLANIIFPQSLIDVGGFAFDATAWYSSQPNGLVYAGPVAYAYKGVLTSPTSITLREGTLAIADYAFNCKKNLKSVIMPNSLIHIGGNAFYGCQDLNGVSLGNSVSSIGERAFYYCSSLENIDIPNSVISIGMGALDGTRWYDNQPEGLVYAGWVAYEYKGEMPYETIISLRDGTLGIAGGAFEGRIGLLSVTIPSSVKSIGDDAFSGCSNLNEVFCHIMDPENVTMGNRVFALSSSNYGGRTLYVPSGTVTTYQSDTRWSQYFGSIVINGTLISSLGLDHSIAEVSVGETLQLMATVLPANATYKSLAWTSSDETIATVNENGLVTAVSPGNTTITATAMDGSGLSTTCIIFVVQKATSISLNATSLSLYDNQNFQLTATVLPENTSDKSVTWHSSSPTIATVNSDGFVTAVSGGITTISATTNDGSNLSAECIVNVNDFVQATSISLSHSNLVLAIDESSQIIATVYPDNTTNQSVIWTSSNASIATVNSDGIITAVNTGTANITATTTDGSNLSASCQVTVVRLANAITLNKSSLSLIVNQTSQLTATVYPSNATNKAVTWESNNPSVATVDDNGLVTAIAVGTATITATTTDGSNLSASCEVTVSIVPVTHVQLNKTSITLDIGDVDTYQLTATITPSNATYQTLVWASSNPAVATVSDNGLVSLVSPGTAIITATTTDGTNLSASCQVTVVKRIKTIMLNESSLSLTLPETTQLIAMITPNDAENQVLNWTSSNTSVATVDNNGFITSNGVGTTTIKATTTDGSSLSASCQVTVTKRYVTSITLNEINMVMHIGDTFQLLADVQPYNASNPAISWSSGNSSVAKVDNTGLVTAVAGGSTYIRASATDGSYIYANCSVQVLPDYYLTLDTLSHIRGESARVEDMQVSLINKNLISGIQFDVTLPANVVFNLVDDQPDVTLDDARATRSHSILTSLLSNGKYRVLVTSSMSKDLKGHDGVLVHMNLVLPQMHNTGNSNVNITNIIASEADETGHTLSNTSAPIRFYYIVGDADANAVVDIADHTATASKILGNSPSPFYYDAANVDGNSSLNVVDLVGITNIALEIRPITVQQAPAVGFVENLLFCDKLKLNANNEAEVNIGMDCTFDFAGFQMDVTLPHGLTLMDAMLGEKASKLGLATETLPDGRIRVLGTSFSDAEVDGACPQLLTLKVKAERNYIPGSQIEFSDILFAERNLISHSFDGLSVEYVEQSSVYELMNEARIYIEDGNIIVDTPVAGTVQIIAVDGRMVECHAQIGHNVYAVDAGGIYVVGFNGNTIKVRL